MTKNTTSAHRSIEGLPDDVLLEIFMHLEVAEVLSLGLVSLFFSYLACAIFDGQRI